MSDNLKREFMTQVDAIMDWVLKRTTFEIMKIFENSLYDSHMELAHKGEEIAQLKLKLQRAEIRLQENESGGYRGAEMNMTQTNEMHRELEDVQDASAQASQVPEIDFEVPDDWCAPLASETMARQDDDGCPSVRLRSLYIPLYPLQLTKQEAIHCDIESHKQTKGDKISTTDSPLERHKSTPVCNEGTQLPQGKSDMKMLLRNLRYEANVLTRSTSHKRTGRKIEKQENTLKSKSTERKVSAIKCGPMKQTVGNDGKEKATCTFCGKVFDTEFDLNVHIQWHKKCQACKKNFRLPSALKQHQRFCAKLKLLDKEAQSTDPPEHQSRDEKETTTPSKKRVINRKERAPSSRKRSKPPVKKHGATKKRSRVLQQDVSDALQARSHAAEKPFSCSMCPKTFCIKRSLKVHTMRIHAGQVTK